MIQTPDELHDLRMLRIADNGMSHEELIELMGDYSHLDAAISAIDSIEFDLAAPKKEEG